jgi:hypothetical protein
MKSFANIRLVDENEEQSFLDLNYKFAIEVS